MTILKNISSNDLGLVCGSKKIDQGGPRYPSMAL